MDNKANAKWREDIKIRIFEWEGEENPKLRYNAVIDFEMPVPNAQGHDVGQIGTFGTTPDEAVRKVLLSPTTHNYINMKAKPRVLTEEEAHEAGFFIPDRRPTDPQG